MATKVVIKTDAFFNFFAKYRQILALSVSDALEGIRRYPSIQELMFELLTLGSTTSYQQSCTEVHRMQLVQLSEYIHIEIMEEITRKAIGTVESQFKSEIVQSS